MSVNNNIRPSSSTVASPPGIDVSELRKTARRLLESGEVKMVIGYGEGYSPGKTQPVFIINPDDTEKLIFDSRCEQNLTLYLKKTEIKKAGKVAIVVKGCDARTINVLLLENQVQRENLVVLGIVCSGVGEPELSKCNKCIAHTPPVYDHLFGEKRADGAWTDDTFADVNKIAVMDPKARWEYWVREFDRCIKCYACRQACPICTCTRCITDKNQPQWVPTSPHAEGNFHWNLTRAWHLVGRCVGCDECHRACPMDINLAAVNWSLIKKVFDEFGFISGMSAENLPPLLTYKEGEEQDFIK